MLALLFGFLTRHLATKSQKSALYTFGSSRGGSFVGMSWIACKCSQNKDQSPLAADLQWSDFIIRWFSADHLDARDSKRPNISLRHET